MKNIKCLTHCTALTLSYNLHTYHTYVHTYTPTYHTYNKGNKDPDAKITQILAIDNNNIIIMIIEMCPFYNNSIIILFNIQYIFVSLDQLGSLRA